MRKLYLFDFDGTLTQKDTLFDFLKFAFPEQYNNKYLKFAPLFVIAKLKLMDPGKVKEKFIYAFFSGHSESDLKQLAQKYFESRNSNLIWPKAKKYLEEINNYHDKFIVSASLDLWLQPFADYFQMGLICTKAQFDETGRYLGFGSENCNKSQKKIRIEKEIDLKSYDEILAFGDTSGDSAMFSIAGQTFFRHFEK